MGSMGSFGIPPNRTYSSQGTINSFHSVFGGSGGGGDTSTPPLLDLSEFPSLNRGQGDTMPQPNPPMPGKQPYGECQRLKLMNILSSFTIPSTYKTKGKLFSTVFVLFLFISLIY